MQPAKTSPRYALALALAALAAPLLAEPELTDLRTRRTGSDWTAFLGPTADSKSPETGLLETWPEGGPPIVWQRVLGEGYSGPSISRGRLFNLDRHGDRVRLTCLKSETGEELWRFEYPTDYQDFYGYSNGPRVTPIVDANRIYIHGAEGMLTCVEFGSGTDAPKRLWQVDTVKEFGVVQNFFGVGSTPVIEGKLLIVMVGGSPPDSPPIHTGDVRSNGSGVVAFDKLTGKVVYTLGDELASYSVPALATIGDRRWCFVFARRGLLGFEPTSGKLDFHYPWRSRKLESVNASNPVVVGDLVFISETYEIGSSLLRVKPGGYDVVWKDGRGRNQSMMTHWNTAVHHEGFLYGSSGRHTPEAALRCIELKTGEVRWSKPGLSRSSLLYADGHFYCLTETGYLILIEATPKKYAPVSVADLHDESGRRLINYPAWGAPVLSHGLLYVRGKDRIVCLDVSAKKAAAAAPAETAAPTEKGSGS